MDSISNIQTYLNSSKKNEKNNSTWVDIFLTNDIYILGAGLDFEELDIWWLLSYRNRELLERKNDINSPAQNTKIIYIDIVAEEYDDTKMLQELSSYDEQLSKVKELVKAEIKKKKNEAKLSMLETFGVEIKTFILDSTENNYRNAYDDVLEYFAKNLIKDKS
jgi:hypothetical protein